MRTASEVISLDDLGVVRARGSDAVRFLQGQVSNDVTLLGATRSLLAGYHNPQGRAIALLRLVCWAADDVLAVVPRELASVVASRLGKFVLRSKVKITDESAAWRISGIIGAPVEPAPELPSAVNAQTRVDDAVFVCVAEDRWLAISPETATVSVHDSDVMGERLTWLRLDVAAGQPQVYAATSEEFVAQMLNLDALNAIAFDKGCYTGQEVIARAHYRGRVKRRMQRFISRESLQLAPGDSGQLADGRGFKVVSAAQLPDGRCDFLAVAPLVGGEREDARPAATPEAVGVAAVVADQASLPYSLPD